LPVECCGATWEPLELAEAFKELRESGIEELLEEASRAGSAEERWELVRRALERAGSLGPEGRRLLSLLLPRDRLRALAEAAVLEAARTSGALGSPCEAAAEIAREALELGVRSQLLELVARAGSLAVSPGDAACVLRVAGLLGG